MISIFSMYHNSIIIPFWIPLQRKNEEDKTIWNLALAFMFRTFNASPLLRRWTVALSIEAKTESLMLSERVKPTI